MPFLEFDGALVWSAVVVFTTITRKYLETADRLDYFWTLYESSMIRQYKTTVPVI